MTVFQGSGQLKYKRVRGLLCSFAAVLILMGFAASASAQSYPWWDSSTAQFNVDDEIELLDAINDTLYSPGNKVINLRRSIGVQNPQLYQLRPGDVVTIKLNGYTFQGNGYVDFTPTSGHADLVIEGSTMDFNEGIRLHGDIKLTYKGMYTSAEDDHIGQNAGDNVEVDLTTPLSGWDAFNHDVIVGEEGTGKFTIANGNWGKSNNLIIGKEATGVGIFDIYGQGTVWTNTENTIVGESGDGHLMLHDGAVINTGNFGVNSTAGTGLAEIWGEGTILNIFGSNTAAAIPTGGSSATMNVYERAEVWLNYNDNLDNGTLRGWAHLALGGGTSSFDNAYFTIDRGVIDGPANDMTFQNRAMFEGTTYGYIKANPTTLGPFGSQGKITLQTLAFEDGGLFSPGYGSKSLWDADAPLDFSQNGMVSMYYLGKWADPFDDNGKIYVDAHGNPLPVGRYGQIDIVGNFDLKQDGVAIFDFDIEGDSNHALVGDPTTPAETKQHKDYVDVTGAANLDGHIHFRPMTGYYQDDVEIQFMDASSGFTGDPNAQLTQWPSRWFEDPVIEDGALKMTRHQTPFHSSGKSFNEHSVGVALDWIYNWRQSLNVDKLMLTQEKDIWFPVLDWFWGMNDDDFRQAMRQLSGETRAASFYMPLRSPWRFGFDRVNWRKRDNHVYFGQQNILSPYVAKQDLWVTPYYDYMHMDNDGNTSGSSISRVSFMAGYDRALSKYTAVGFLFGYSQPKLDQVYSRVIADDYLLGLHFNTRIANDFELKLWGSYGIQNYRLDRDVPIRNGEHLSAKYSGNSISGSAQIAKPISWCKGVIRPLAAIDYAYVKQDTAEEDGYFPIALRYNSSDWSQLFGRVGVRGDFGCKRASLTGTLSYSYQFAGDVEPTCTNQFLIGGPEFDIKGSDLSRSFVNVGLGTQVYLNRLKSRMFFVQYNGIYGANTNSQYASIGYQMTF